MLVSQKHISYLTFKGFNCENVGIPDAIELISCSDDILIQAAAFTTSPLIGGATTHSRKQARTPPIVSGVIISHFHSEIFEKNLFLLKHSSNYLQPVYLIS